MKIFVNAELRYGGRSGVQARSPDLNLTAHGIEEQDALQSLKRGIIAWCDALRSRGKIEEVLKRKRLNWEMNGDATTVELNVIES
jgi:hypothetical protein